MAIGQYRHRVTLEAPGDPVPDGEGGWTEGWAPLTPATWDCSIQAASQRDLESIGAGTVLAQATHLLKGRFHQGITTETRIHWDEYDETGALIAAHVMNVIYAVNRDLRRIEHDLIAAEVVS